MQKYMCDFETSTENWLNYEDTARVWCACIASIEATPKIISINLNIEDFMKSLFKLGNCECYFHNLKFDGEFIIYWLLTNGYKYDEKGNKEKTFNCVISDAGVWYKITITHKVFNKRYVRTHIYDSYKKLPLKVSQIAKAFKLEETKGTIDYDLYRPVGYQPNENELDYIKNDCIIVAKALYEQLYKGLDKMTIGSDALNNFKTEIGGKKAFKYLYPVLPLAVDNDFRKAYRGGFTMVNPHFQNKVISGISYDVNSLYPSVMYGNMGLLPYGLPKKFTGEYKKDKNYPLYIQKIACKFKLKKDKIPTIQLKNNLSFIPTEYITDSKDIVDLVLTGVDIELLKDHYDIEYIEYFEGYKFKGSDNIFKGYIDYWGEIKANSTGGLRQLAKLMLNSLYGKFATNPKKQNKTPKLIDDEVELELNEPTYDDPVYTALGAYITARARDYTIRTSQMLYKHWVYSDTDSLYLTGISEEDVEKLIEVHPTKLGAWKLEHHFNSGKWLRPKTYILNSVEDGLSIACAGMPDNIKSEIISKGVESAFNSFTYGAEFKGKLIPKRVKGGVILFNETFTIKQ